MALHANWALEQELIAAARLGNLDVVDRLLAVPGVDATAQNNRALVDAIIHRHSDVACRLLDLPGLNVASDNHQLLVDAAKRGMVRVVDRLLALPGVAATDQPSQALIYAAIAGFTDVVHRLLAVPSINAAEQDNRALLEAISRGHIQVIQLLLGRPGVPGAQTTQAIHLAISKRLWAVVEILLTNRSVVENLRLDEVLLTSALARHLKAMELCSQDRGKWPKGIGLALKKAYKVSYQIVRVDAELPTGVMELVCEGLVASRGLAHWTLNVQRQIRRRLRQLASVANR